MASIPADDNLEVVEIVAYDPNDCENENVLKSEDESDREEQEMEVDTGGDEQENERVQQSSEEKSASCIKGAVVDSNCDAGGRQK